MIPVQEANPEGRKFQFLRRGQGFIQTKYGRVKYPRLPSSNPAGTMPLIQSNPTDPPENRPPSDSGCHELEEGSLQTNRTSSSEMTMHDYDTTAAFEHLEQRISAESTPMQGLGHGRPRVTEVRATGGTSDRESVESGELGSLTSSNWNQRPTITPSPSLQEPYEGQQQRRDRLAPPASTLPSTVVDGDGRSAPTVQPFAPLPPSLRRFPPPPPVFNPPLHFPLPQRNQPNSWVPRPSPLLNDYFTNTEQRPVHPFAVGVRPVEQQRLADQLRAMIAQLDLDQAACKRAREEFEKVKAQMAEERAESRREVDALRSEFEEYRDIELEKLRKSKSFLERQKKLIDKDESERIKLLKEEIVDLQNDICERDRRSSDQRAKIRELECKLSELEKSAAQLRLDNERLVQRNRTLEQSTAKIRGQAAQQAMTLQAQGSVARRSSRPQSTGTPEALRRAYKENVAPSSAPPLTNGASKTVRFQLPDDAASPSTNFDDSTPVKRYDSALSGRQFGTQLQQHDHVQVMSPLNGMKVVRTEYTETGGVCTTYADASSWTKHTLEADRCSNYLYSNGDIKWIHSSKVLTVDRFANGQMTEAIVNGKAIIRHFVSGQLDIFHDGDGHSVSCYKPTGMRVEIFDGKIEKYLLDGTMTMRRQNERVEVTVPVVGSRSTFRNDQSFVETRSDGSTELHTASYVLRRWPTGDVKIKFIVVDVELTMLVNGLGTIKHVLPSAEKRLCCEWPRQEN